LAQGLETQKEDALDTRKSAKDRWQEAYSKGPERDAEFSTMSGVPVKPL
jgi:methylmalonyl-CoA mutase N-terminal domain/subunit